MSLIKSQLFNIIHFRKLRGQDCFLTPGGMFSAVSLTIPISDIMMLRWLSFFYWVHWLPLCNSFLLCQSSTWLEGEKTHASSKKLTLTIIIIMDTSLPGERVRVIWTIG